MQTNIHATQLPPLLLTKCSRPSLRAHHTHRPELLQLLTSGTQGKLTLIAAPTGFGKTTLVTEWLEDTGHKPAWFSIEKEDDELHTFLRYLLSSIQTVVPTLGKETQSYLQQMRLPPLRNLLTPLLNECHTCQKPLFIVLDDYQHITEPAIHKAMDFMLQNLPAQVHITLISRATPPLELHHLRFKGDLLELGIPNLSFKAKEIEDYFAQQLQVALSTEQRELLQNQTEGWIAGLQLVGLSLKRSGEHTTFLQNLQSHQTHIQEFLSQEVLHAQSQDLRDFLLQSSILKHMNASLCDYVLQRTDSTIIFKQLEQQQLFLIPLNQEQGWYRYHHLFSELLQKQLQNADKQKCQKLHQRASKWYQERGGVYEALRYLVAGGDAEQACQLAQDSIVQHDNQLISKELIRWSKILPKDRVSQYPRLTSYIILALTQLQKIELLKQWFRQLMRQLPEWGSGDNAKENKGYLHFVLQHKVRVDRDFEASQRHCQQALKALPEREGLLRSHTLLFTITNQVKASGNAQDCIQLADQAYTESYHLQDLHNMLFASSLTAYLQWVTGQLHAVQSTCQRMKADFEADESMEIEPVMMSEMYAFLGEVARQQDLQSALPDLKKAIELATLYGNYRGLYLATASLIAIHQAKGEVEKARTLTQELSKPSLKAINLSQLSYINIMKYAVLRGDLSLAKEWVQQDALKRVPSVMFTEPFTLLKIRILLAEGVYDEAEALLKGFSLDEVKSNRRSFYLEHQLLSAKLYANKGQDSLAMDLLDSILEWTQAQGYIRFFSDEGPVVYALLQKILKKRYKQPSSRASYLERLLHSFTKEPVKHAKAQKHTQTFEKTLFDVKRMDLEHKRYLLDPLSKRELELLQEAADGLSNKELSQKFYIAEATVKKHMSNIYSKLGVKKRAKAIKHARDLQLIT